MHMIQLIYTFLQYFYHYLVKQKLMCNPINLKCFTMASSVFYFFLTLGILTSIWTRHCISLHLVVTSFQTKELTCILRHLHGWTTTSRCAAMSSILNRGIVIFDCEACWEFKVSHCLDAKFYVVQEMNVCTLCSNVILSTKCVGLLYEWKLDYGN